jgi:hypothetical protein
LFVPQTRPQKRSHQEQQHGWVSGTQGMIGRGDI